MLIASHSVISGADGSWEYSGKAPVLWITSGIVFAITNRPFLGNGSLGLVKMNRVKQEVEDG